MKKFIEIKRGKVKFFVSIRKLKEIYKILTNLTKQK
jgi:hypothetical protein